MGLVERHARRLIRQKVKKPARAAVKRAMSRWCAECQKNQPLIHTCEITTDFKRRRAAAARQQKAAQRRRARAERRKAAKGKSAPRQPRERHPYQTCTDQDCQRTACTAFREGVQACPLEHA